MRKKKTEKSSKNPEVQKKEIDVDLYQDHILPVARLIEAWDQPERVSLTEWNYFEMMDRLSVIMSNLDQHCIEHSVSREVPELGDKLEQAMTLLWEAYQLIGEKMASQCK
jgi:hypothetical protein